MADGGAAGPSGNQQGGAQKGGRGSQKDKLSSLSAKVQELEAELAELQQDCAQLDEQNAALLAQAEEREAQLARDKAQLEAAPVAPQSAPSASTPAATAAAAAATAAATPQASAPGSSDPSGTVMVIRSCPGFVFTITPTMLESSPRLDLERVYGTLLQRIQATSQQHAELEGALKASLLRADSSSAPAADLQQQMTGLTQGLWALVRDTSQLYGHAFRADPRATAAMQASVLVMGKDQDPAALERRLRMTEDGKVALAQSIKQYLAVVMECMETRKQLQSKLCEASDALLEWESVAQWLNNEATITQLQTTLAREVDAYLEWVVFVCCKVWTPIQAAQYLPYQPIGNMLQVCCSLLRPEGSPPIGGIDTSGGQPHAQQPGASSSLALTPVWLR